MQAGQARFRMHFSVIIFITAVFFIFNLFIISAYSKNPYDQGNDWHSPVWWYPLGHEGLQSNHRGIAIIPMTNQAVVTNNKSNTVLKIDLYTQTVLSEVQVGKEPKGIALDSELYIALVANSHDNTVSFIDLDRFNVISTLRVGKSPAGIAIDQTTHTAVITSLDNDSISFVDLTTREIVATTKTGEIPIDVAVIGSTEGVNNGDAIDPARSSGRGIALVINNESHNISVIDLATHKIIKNIDVKKEPHTIDVNPKTHLAVVTHEKDHSVTVIDTQTWYKWMIRIGKYPVDVAVNTFTNQAAVVCNEDQTLVQVDLGTNEIIQTYPLKKHPQAVAVNRFTNAAAVIEDRLGGLTLIQLQSTDNLPKVSITSPTNNAILNASPIMVSGTVKNADLVVVNDVTATIITGESFSAMVGLSKEGSNTLTAVATDQTGRTGYHSITVNYVPVLRGTIAGTVVNAITGDPILGATVSITDTQGVIKTAVTNANGGFSIIEVAVGDFRGSAVKAGYSTFGFAGTAIAGQTSLINAPLEPILPVISGITVTEITADSASVSWTTDQSADSLVEYGETEAYGGSKVDTALTTIHNLVLTSLTSSRTYHFRVISTSANRASVISGDNTFKTQNRIDITITTPADGVPITGQNVMVTGTVSSSANDETGVTVNGIVSNLMGSQFAVSHVSLNPGANTITVKATCVDGTTATKSVTVAASAANHDIKLAAYPESGTAPLEVALRIDGSFSIANPSIVPQGQNPVDQLPSTNPDEYKYKINTEGVYYFTAQAIGPDNNSYQDTIVITVLPLAQIDNLLRAKWSDITGALQQKNTTTALNLMLPDSREKYQIMFDMLKDQLPSIVATYVDLELESIQENGAWYELTAMQEGALFSYRVGFMKDANGLWLLQEF